MAEKRREENLIEMLSQHIRRIERFDDATADQDIILSKEHRTSVLKEDMGIRKMPITWPLYRYNMFYIVTVPPETTVPTHEHSEDVFRLVIDGSLILNSKHTVEKGEWFVVKSGVKYKVKTTTGYTALSAYTSICQTRRGSAFTTRKKGPQPPRA